jgi:hypothetical protein
VFSNLVRVSSELWETFAHRGVRLATSYYSDDAAEHEAITRGRGSHARIKANITEALRRSIPLRVAWSTCRTANGLSRPAPSWRLSA